MDDKIFEIATKEAYRFETKKGMIDVERLWHLKLVSMFPNDISLNDIAKTINKQLKDNEDDFVYNETKKNKELEIKFKIVKHIIGVRLKEEKETEERLKNIQKKATILDIINKKQNESYENMEIDELKEMIKSM